MVVGIIKSLILFDSQYCHNIIKELNVLNVFPLQYHQLRFNELIKYVIINMSPLLFCKINSLL